MNFRFLRPLALGLMALFTVTSCINDDDDYTGPDPYENVAFGAVVNASPSSGDLFFYADSNQVNANGLGYDESAGYFNFYTGDRTLTLKNTSGDDLATAEITLEGGEYFSAFAVNTFDNIELVTYRDSLVYPPQGKALVRFINLSPDAPAVNIDAVTPAQNYAANLEFKQATGFMALTPGIYSFTFTNTATEEGIYTKEAVEIMAGRIYTIYTKGFITPPDNSNDTFDAEKLLNY